MMRILVVDDHALVREALATGLKLLGHDVAEAADGGAALDAMEKRLPDVLVTDLDMPGMGGLELIDRTRRAYPKLPIVAMTAGGAGANIASRLQKPFSTSQLMVAIKSAIAAA